MSKFLEKLNKRNSLVCVGLDVDLEKIPLNSGLKPTVNNIFAFNKYIIDATKDFTGCYKPNMAFYEMYGMSGLKALYETLKYIPKEIPVILDAKRGDIGNTSKAYAKAVFEDFNADAVTLSPYMGEDSVGPFLEYKDRFAYVLCLTSNKGSADLQKPDLYKRTAKKIAEWNTKYGNCGAVVGATNDQEILELRQIMPEVNFLIPGVGAQGGDLENTVRSAKDAHNKGFVINSSRGIIYANNPGQEAQKLAADIQKILA